MVSLHEGYYTVIDDYTFDFQIVCCLTRNTVFFIIKLNCITYCRSVQCIFSNVPLHFSLLVKSYGSDRRGELWSSAWMSYTKEPWILSY